MILEKILNPKEDFYIHSEEEIDMLFDELRSSKLEIRSNHDYAIRLAIKKVKLQKYYESKLREYRGKGLNESTKKNEVKQESMLPKKDEPSKRKRKRIKKIEEKITKEIEKKKKIINNTRKENNPVEKPQKREYSFEALKKKTWILDWNCVMFKNGCVVIFSRSEMNVKFKPTKIYTPKYVRGQVTDTSALESGIGYGKEEIYCIR